MGLVPPARKHWLFSLADVIAVFLPVFAAISRIRFRIAPRKTRVFRYCRFLAYSPQYETL